MSKRILICNERLLFRFGVDRILLTLAGELVKQGASVTLLCVKADKQIKQAFRGAVKELEDVRDKGLMESEFLCLSHLRRMLSQSAQKKPFDLIICGGWPFFAAAIAGQQNGIATVFIDAGSVPHTGLHGNARTVQTLLRKIRSLTLPHFTRVLPISEFIRHNQTIPDRGHAEGVETIYLGVDHLEKRVFTPFDKSTEAAILKRLQDLRASGTKLVLNLGRFEAIGYKNSPSAIRIVRQVVRSGRKTRLIILEDRAVLAKVPGLGGLSRVEAVGKVSDQTLVEIMKLADAGLSVSLWEGFNLPIGEMQRLGKPVVAYHIGAHAEVIAHPWCLALSEPELAQKLSVIVDGCLPAMVKRAIARWQKKPQFTWKSAIGLYARAFNEILDNDQMSVRPAGPKTVLVDVTNASVDTANSGVMRVTRRLLGELQKLGNMNLIFIRWNGEHETYELLSRAHGQILATYGGPHDLWSLEESLPSGRPLDLLELDLLVGNITNPILFMPEIALDGSATTRVDWANSRNIQVSAILYDLIPISHSQFCDTSIVEVFPEYIQALLKAESIASISTESLKQLEAYRVREILETSSKRTTIWLPGQFSDFPRAQHNLTENLKPDDEYEIVCVSTIEPRKNHLRLIEAFKHVRQQHKNVKLILIGNSYAGRPDYQAQFLAAINNHPSIEWKGSLSDADAAAAIERAHFTVYPSVVEGFGLPILESLWLGTPCLCHSAGVMNELAKDGGCLTVNMENASDIANGLERLLNENKLQKRLAQEALERPITTWSQYATQIGAKVLALNGSKMRPTPNQSHTAFKDEIDTRMAGLDRHLTTINQFENLAQSGKRQAGNAGIGANRTAPIKHLVSWFNEFPLSRSWRHRLRKLRFKLKN